MGWQVQQAKQRFSEMLRQAESAGDQIVTRHGEEVAAVVAIGEYRRLRSLDSRLGSRPHLGLFPPLGDDEYAAVLDEIAAARPAAARRPALFEDM